MVRNFRRSGQEPDDKLTFSNNAYLKLTTEWIMLHGCSRNLWKNWSG